LIKPNLIEFQELIRKKVTTIREVIQEAKKLSEKILLICISSVEGGALLITPKKIWFGQIPTVRIKTTVGAGDAMVGAMTAQLWKTKFSISGDDLLRWGLAAAAATLITPGTMLGKYDKVLYYYPKIKIIEIS
jgi:fructose-1-phosphate kinase PfkB-like protein